MAETDISGLPRTKVAEVIQLFATEVMPVMRHERPRESRQLLRGRPEISESVSPSVMPALVAGIHVFMAVPRAKAWMAGTSPAMTISIDRSTYSLTDP
jgi:hypothetical protein